jgi:apolipoprotein N-acyltransferase
MGFGYFVAGLWWVGSACLVDAGKFAWALPLGVLALPAGLAFFPAFGFAVARLVWSPGAARVLALALGLGVSEWARGLLFTGFPWNDLGMALGSHLVLAQVASVVGLHGLTFLAIAIFAAPATLLQAGDGPRAVAPTILAILTVSIMGVFGAVRLEAPASPTVPRATLRIIQPNVSQGVSFAPENKDLILRSYFALSEGRMTDGGKEPRRITNFIWPESAFPFILSRDAQALSEIADFLRDGAVLITGAARVESDSAGQPAYYNSIEVLDRRGLTHERYDKQHLVPFGEYIPFRPLLERLGVTQFVQFPGGFSPGSGPRILRIPGLPVVMPLICYEAIFPNEIGDVFSIAQRPDWMLNVTDDAWFGLTPGPSQHYAQARLRAIELGLPLVRAANSGRSAVLDGLGRELAFAPLGAEGALDFDLPKALPATIQARYGSLGAALLALAFFSLCLIRRRRR